jgi:hypothetical protein
MAGSLLASPGEAVDEAQRAPAFRPYSGPMKTILLIALLALSGLAIVSALALSGTLMEPLPWGVLAALLASAAAFALMLDQVKLRVRSLFKVG